MQNTAWTTAFTERDFSTINVIKQKLVSWAKSVAFGIAVTKSRVSEAAVLKRF